MWPRYPHVSFGLRLAGWLAGLFYLMYCQILMLFFVLTATSGHPINFSKAAQRLQCYNLASCSYMIEFLLLSTA